MEGEGIRWGLVRGDRASRGLLLRLEGLCHYCVLISIKDGGPGRDGHNGAERTTDSIPRLCLSHSSQLCGSFAILGSAVISGVR